MPCCPPGVGQCQSFKGSTARVKCNTHHALEPYGAWCCRSSRLQNLVVKRFTTVTTALAHTMPCVLACGRGSRGKEGLCKSGNVHLAQRIPVISECARLAVVFRNSLLVVSADATLAVCIRRRASSSLEIGNCSQKTASPGIHIHDIAAAAACICPCQAHNADHRFACRVKGLREALVSRLLPPHAVVRTLDDISDTVSCSFDPASHAACCKHDVRHRCSQTLRWTLRGLFVHRTRAAVTLADTDQSIADMSGLRRSRVLSEHAPGCGMAPGGAAGLHQARRCGLSGYQRAAILACFTFTAQVGCGAACGVQRVICS